MGMKVVIDTNVLLVANGKHENISYACVVECITRLQKLQKTGIVVIDDGGRILKEYHNKTKPNQPKGVGDVFLKWLLNNKGDLRRVCQVGITETTQDCFEEFPIPQNQNGFDPPDRKFVATSNAHPEKPEVWQASDCKWLEWQAILRNTGIHIEFLCLQDVCRYYAAKFPDKPTPVLCKLPDGGSSK